MDACKANNAHGVNEATFYTMAIRKGIQGATDYYAERMSRLFINGVQYKSFEEAGRALAPPGRNARKYARSISSIGYAATVDRYAGMRKVYRGMVDK